VPIPNEIKVVIDQLRAQHPQLAALADEQILELMIRGASSRRQSICRETTSAARRPKTAGHSASNC
jgi:uncharacterized protein YoaH (UPF0181 family)